jgi:hypothetical protein
MKVNVTKLGGIHTNKAHLSLEAVCLGQDIKPNEINMDHKATLMIGERKISCTVARVSKNKSGSYDFLLCTPESNYDFFKPYHHKNNLNFALLLEETVALNDLAEANALLDELSRKERRSRADLLCELTKFNRFPGHRDLNLVSAKQMPILLDKISKRLYPEREKAAAQA